MTEYVPRTLEYVDDEPLAVNGSVVAVLHANPRSRRCTVLVAEEETETEPETVTCVGKDGECSREVDEYGDYCWQHEP